MITETATGTVVAVHCNQDHLFSKPTVDTIRLDEGLGVFGDAHYGVTVKHRSRVAVDPSQPNLRQVHLMHAELFERLAGLGYRVESGDLGENITTRGIDLLALPVGTRLTIGDAVITITGLRNPCRQINDYQSGLLKELVHTDADGQVVRLAGVMGIVSRGGQVVPGAPVQIGLPPEPHFPLTRV